jgi:hypothetical protein
MATAPKLKPGQGGFTFDATVFLGNLEALAPPKSDPAIALALVDTAKSGIAKASSLIAKRTGLRSAVVKSRLSYDSVRVGDYQVTIRSSRKPIPLYDFPGTAQTASGVRTRAWGRSQVLGSAFVATMRTGHRGAFRRRGRTRLPIRELWGPTIYGTFRTSEVQGLIRTTLQDRLRVSLLRRLAAAQRRVR